MTKGQDGEVCVEEWVHGVLFHNNFSKKNKLNSKSLKERKKNE